MLTLQLSIEIVTEESFELDSVNPLINLKYIEELFFVG